MKRSTFFSVTALVLATTLFISVCLPWFQLPIMGWAVPVPAWSKAGLVCIALSGLLLMRALAGWFMRWPVRVTAVLALYYWWLSIAEAKAWGARHLAPLQLKLGPVNQTLSKLGGDSLTVYEPALWKSLEPHYGWYCTGALIFLVIIVNLRDGPLSLTCSSCQTEVKEADHFCHSCGHSVASPSACRNCGASPRSGDSFCRLCGKGLGLENET